MEPEKRDRLNKLENKLYSRKGPDIVDPGRSDLTKPDTAEIGGSWQGTNTGRFDVIAGKLSRVAESRHSIVKKFFAIALVLFVVSAGAAAFVFFGGANFISSENVDIKVVGPISVGGGQESSFDINIINSNNTPLESVSLLVEYPPGTKLPTDLAKDLVRERFPIGEIKSNQNYIQNIKAFFFGEKEKVLQIKMSLEYRIPNSSATFFKEKEHELSISSAPIIITPIYPKEVNSNQEISFNIEIASNSKDTIGNLLLKVEYPFGFVFRGSSPQVFAGNNTWNFSDIKSGEKRNVSIKGVIIGQDNEERVFRISVGTPSSDDDRMIAVKLGELVESVLVKKPFIGLDVSIAGRGGDYAATGGVPVETAFTLRNNLPSRLFNVSVEVALSGGALDKTNVFSGQGGFFRSVDNVILWDSRSISTLVDIAPGDDQRFSFRLTPLQYQNINKGARPEIDMVITAKGERVLESGSVESVTATERRKIILATDLKLVSRTTRSEGSFENSGPIPPKADQPSTYTIVWSIQNSFNQVNGAEVRATLPAYVRWTGLSNPSGENFSFNQVTNEVVWNVGTILPNTGFVSAPKQVYFQVEYLPSSSQIGSAPVLVGEATLVGKDKVTGADLGVSALPATTNFSTDSTFKPGDDKVSQ